MYYVEMVPRFLSKGLSIKSETTFLSDVHNGIKETVTYVRFTGNKRNRGHSDCYHYERCILDICNMCGKPHKKTICIWNMPYSRKYHLMQSKYSSILKKFERDNLKMRACRSCISAYYKQFKLEFDNLEIKSQLTELGREIRWQSKQPET